MITMRTWSLRSTSEKSHDVRLVTIYPWGNRNSFDLASYRYRAVCSDCPFQGPTAMKKTTAQRHVDAHKYVGRHRVGLVIDSPDTVG